MKRSILITGASGGIGRALVSRLADDFQIYATGRNADLLQALPEGVHTLSGDLASDVFRTQLSEWATGVTSIVHNAGFAPNVSVEDTDSAFDRMVFETNAIAPLDLTRKLQRSLLQGAPGRVVSSRALPPTTHFLGSGRTQLPSQPWSRWFVPFRGKRMAE